MIQNDILSLTEYALKTGLIQPADKAYTRNRLLELFELDELEVTEETVQEDSLDAIPWHRMLLIL